MRHSERFEGLDERVILENASCIMLGGMRRVGQLGMRDGEGDEVAVAAGTCLATLSTKPRKGMDTRGPGHIYWRHRIPQLLTAAFVCEVIHMGLFGKALSVALGSNDRTGVGNLMIRWHRGH